MMTNPTKLLTILLSLAIIITSVGCGTATETSLTRNTSDIDGGILITFFTEPEESGIDTLAGASRIAKNGEIVGNTEWIADRIHEIVGGSRHAIQTVHAYPADHEELVKQGTLEKSNNSRPELTTHIGNMDSYDVVFIGYPIWWDDLPMPVYSFLEEYDFSGKKIIPFSTHGGSNLAGTVKTIRRIVSDAELAEEAFTVSRTGILESNEDIADWLEDLGY